MEPIFNQWISEMQQGFLQGRSMLSNVVKIEHISQLTALQEDKGATILLDFKAAFPSVSQEYLREILAALGVPDNALNFIDNLYAGHRCNILFGGESHPGFALDSGIRQGCPLSPVIFALIMDILLRRLP